MPKTRAQTDFPDPLVLFHKYKAYHQVKKQRYNEGQRPSPHTFRATIPSTWLKSYLSVGCYKKADGSKWSFDEINDETLFGLYCSPQEIRLKEDLHFRALKEVDVDYAHFVQKYG